MEKPVIALRGLSVLPNMSAHFDVSRDKSAAALDKAMESDQMVFLVTQRDPELEEPEQEDPVQIRSNCPYKSRCSRCPAA